MPTLRFTDAHLTTSEMRTFTCLMVFTEAYHFTLFVCVTFRHLVVDYNHSSFSELFTLCVTVGMLPRSHRFTVPVMGVSLHDQF